jgi:hypothetical protein
MASSLRRNPFIGCAAIELQVARAISKVLFAIAVGQRPTAATRCCWSLTNNLLHQRLLF